MARKLIAEAVLKGDEKVKGKLKGIQTQGSALGGALKSKLMPVPPMLMGIAAAAAVAAGGLKLAGQAFGAWVGEMEAIHEMNSALKATGQLTTSNSQAMQDFASEFQSMTTFGNEAVLSWESMALTMGATTTEIETLIPSVAGLGRTFKQDVESMLPRVMNFVDGTTNSLSRLGIKIDKTATREERLNAIMAKGAAGLKLLKSDTDSLTGAQKQLSNAWGDALEIAMKMTGVTMPGLVAAIKEVSREITIFAETYEESFRRAGHTADETEIQFESTAIRWMKWISKLATAFFLFEEGVAIVFNGIQWIGLQVGASMISVFKGIYKGVIGVINGLLSAYNFLADLLHLKQATLLDTNSAFLDSWANDVKKSTIKIEYSMQTHVDKIEALMAAETAVLYGSRDAIAASVGANDGAADSNEDLADSIDKVGTSASKATAGVGALETALNAIDGMIANVKINVITIGQDVMEVVRQNALPSPYDMPGVALNKGMEAAKSNWAYQGKAYETATFGDKPDLQSYIDENNERAEGAADAAADAAQSAEDQAFATGESVGSAMSKGIMANDWSALGQEIGSYIMSQMNFAGGILGGIGSGLFSGFLNMGIKKLFGGGGGGGGGSPIGSRQNPMHTLVINPEDIATSFLVATQNAQLRQAGAGLTQLGQQRLSQAAAGLTV